MELYITVTFLQYYSTSVFVTLMVIDVEEIFKRDTNSTEVYNVMENNTNNIN